MLHFPFTVPGFLYIFRLRFSLFQNSFQQFLSRFQLILMRLTPLAGQFPFDGGFEDSLAVALELGFGLFQFSDAGIELGEEFFDFGYDAFLFGERGDGNVNGICIISI